MRGGGKYMRYCSSVNNRDCFTESPPILKGSSWQHWLLKESLLHPKRSREPTHSKTQSLSSKLWNSSGPTQNRERANRHLAESSILPAGRKQQPPPTNPSHPTKTDPKQRSTDASIRRHPERHPTPHPTASNPMKHIESRRVRRVRRVRFRFFSPHHHRRSWSH